MRKAEITNNIYNGKIYHRFSIGTKGNVCQRVCTDLVLFYNEDNTDCQIVRMEDLKFYESGTNN